MLPTRGRPQLAERFFSSVIAESVRLESVEIVLYVDDDDVESHQLDSPDVRVRRIIGPRLTMGQYNSRCLAEARGDIIVLANDDMVIRTRGWDERLRALDASIPDRIYLAYCNDLFKGAKLCAFPILSRRTCELLADPFPAAYKGAFIDHHLLDIFQRLRYLGNDRIRYLDDVIFEHLHYRTGKAEKDQTYVQRSRFADDGDFLLLMPARRAAAERLQRAIRGEALPAPVAFVPDSGSYPSGLIGALVFMSRQVLTDRAMSPMRRASLWCWFVGRLLAVRGWLRPFVGSR